MRIHNDSILFIDKPPHMTSFGAVARLRRVLAGDLQKKPKNTKVGHAGTLDPFATGLLIVATGRECKTISQFVKQDKTYEATIVLGMTSTTGDPEGDLSPVSTTIRPELAEVEQACSQFIGEIIQTPPVYSAIKIGGRRAYDLARSGVVVDMPPRTIKIYSLVVKSYDYPYLIIEAKVSSGTYVRTLAEDIGTLLKTGAYCQALRRTAIGSITIDQAAVLADYGIVD